MKGLLHTDTIVLYPQSRAVCTHVITSLPLVQFLLLWFKFGLPVVSSVVFSFTVVCSSWLDLVYLKQKYLVVLYCLKARVLEIIPANAKPRVNRISNNPRLNWPVNNDKLMDGIDNLGREKKNHVFEYSCCTKKMQGIVNYRWLCGYDDID